MRLPAWLFAACALLASAAAARADTSGGASASSRAPGAAAHVWDRLTLNPSPAAATPSALASLRFDDRRGDGTMPRAFGIVGAISAVRVEQAGGAAEPAPPRVVFVYSDGYRTRAKIHRLASFATLPLFALEAVLGAKVSDNDATVTRTLTRAHRDVGYGLLGLFGANSFTGIWNLWEARKDPNDRTRRAVHGVLMLVADAGFAGAALTAPGHSASDQLMYDVKKGEHTALAVTAISAATVGYLIMLLGR